MLYLTVWVDIGSNRAVSVEKTTTECNRSFYMTTHFRPLELTNFVGDGFNEACIHRVG